MKEPTDLTPQNIAQQSGIALRKGNSLVTRGLKDIAQHASRIQAEELVELGRKCSHYEQDQAIEYFTKAIRLDQTFAVAYTGRGAIYLSQKDFNSAIVDFTEAIRLDPKSAWVFNQRGIAYFHKGAFDLAIADFNEDLRLDPIDRVGRTIRVSALLKMGQYNAVIEDLAEAFRIDPTYPNDIDSLIRAYLHRSLAYREKGDHAASESDFAKAKSLRLKQYPEYPEFSSITLDDINLDDMMF